MTTVLKDSGTKTFDDVILEDLTINGNATITGTINNPTSLEIGTPTFIINGGAGDTKLQIKADTDNSGETDNPIIELIQDGTDVNSTIGCGIRSGETNGNALIINNSIPSGSEFVATGGIVFKTGRTGDITTTTERLVIDPDGNTNVLGDLTLQDDKFIKFGQDGQDMSIGHDPSTNLVVHSAQLQFRSTMTSGDSYKFLETLRRNSTWLFSTDNASGAEKTNSYFFYGNDDTGSANSTYFSQGIRAADNSGLQTVSTIRQEGATIDTATITHFCPTHFENDLTVKDNKSLFIGSSEDLKLVHDTNHSYIDEQGTGDLRIRSNASNITLHSSTSATTGNFMARFLSGDTTELYHNNALKLSTTVGGVLIGDAFSHNDTNLAFTTTTAQFILGGTHNTGQPSGSPTVKLLITGTDNDDNPPIDYHCAMVDENGEIDFYAKASYASGNNTAEFQFRGEILNNYRTAIAAGSGFDTATLKSNIRMIDNEIVSTFLIDLDEGPIKSQNGLKIIGEDGSSAAQITQIQSVLNGYVYKVELCCVETPAGGNTDIDLVFNATAQATGSTSFTSIVNGGSQVRGKCTQALLDGSFDLDFKLLHLANGSGTSTGDYTAGKFIVKLYGANF